MNNSVKFFLACFIIPNAVITITGCKSNPVSDSSSVVTKDTMVVDRDTSALSDTASKVAVPLSDSVESVTPLTVIVTNLASETAPVIIGLYSSKNKFPDPKDQMKEYKFMPNGKIYAAKITGLNFDTYALAIYQDVNSNGKIDKNLIGIPTEPYAFSKNYKPTIKAPAFNDCKFTYSANSDTITIKMIR